MTHQRTYLWGLLLLFFAVGGPAQAEVRTWQGANGSRVEAEYVSQAKGQVVLRKGNDKTVTVPIAKLSASDQQHLEGLEKADAKPAAGTAISAEKSDAIQKVLEGVVRKDNLPGMVAAISSSDGILAIGSAGIRKYGSDEAFTDQDLVHLGSDTKAMTSVLMATLVRDGTLTWETTVIEAMPKLKNRIHEDYHAVTLWELLTHRSGIAANAKVWGEHDGMKVEKQRIELMKDNLKNPSGSKRGDYLYSNLGYMVAGCMAEELTGSSWEVLMQERIFDPLGMATAGFGAPGKQGKRDQPWGHNKDGSEWRPLQSDNPAALGPAGTVHCSLEDWAKFIAIQLPNGNQLGLSQTLLKKLITPVGTYAGGWSVGERSWAKGAVLSHAGSNTMWYAIVWVAPNLDRAFMVVTNSKDTNSSTVCEQVVAKLIEINQ